MPAPFPRLDPTTPAASEVERENANKLLLSVMEGARASVRSYDTKAQIIEAGYIVFIRGAALPRSSTGKRPHRSAVLRGGVVVVITPIVQLGEVFHMSRPRADREFAAKTSGGPGHPHVYHVDPDGRE